ncbi:MAG TPA: protein kinase [Ktedonobacteraceae bacterium]|nr:protein kinase [Ktedonobacteraceae bacterium]
MDVGRQLGNYLLIRLLGQGGFADVYLGQHKILQTYAAIKVMNAHLSSAELQNFVREARTIANLKHPAIVRILDFDVADNTTPFLVMDHAPHGTLRQRHPRGSQVPLATVVSYVHQVAAALQYAHDQKLIHRDVKPENMLIGSKHEIVLSDFGIAVVAHSTYSRKVEDIVGTWTYAAPELFLGTPYPATDQYALAIVAYEWLCGTPPFRGDFPALYHQHMNVTVPSLRQKMPTLPPAIEQVILTALAKDPHQRYICVQAFANALEAASQSQSSQPMFSSLPAPVIQHVSPLSMNAPVLSIKIIPCPHCGGLIGARSIFCNVCGTQLAVSASKTVRVLAAPSLGTTLLTYSNHSSSVYAVAWSPDGHLLASASFDGTVQVWESSGGKRRLTYRGQSHYVTAVAWSPDGCLLASASYDKTVQVWEASTGKPRLIYNGHSGLVNVVVWSPDGRLLASASWDKTVQVWEASTGKPCLTYRGHSDRVNAVVWSPDGRLLASASEDRTVQVWQAV